MIAGFGGHDRARKVVGIDASVTLDKTFTQVARIARHAAELIGPVYQIIQRNFLE